MEATTTQQRVDQLRKRREQIDQTLRHIGKEHAEVERNTEWISREAYERRAKLLSRVRSWYVAEINEIDAALKRAGARRYGICAGCGQRIEEQRLDNAPAIEYCGSCERRRDHGAAL
jgi:RNA polymerase-binding transcription factor DksA